MLEDKNIATNDSDSDSDSDNITDFLKDDVVLEHKPNVEKLQENKLSNILNTIKNMDNKQRNSLLNTLQGNLNMNPTDKQYNEMSQDNYTKLRLRQKLKQKQMERLNKQGKQNMLDNMQLKTQSSNSTAIQPDQMHNDDSENVIEISAKTLKNRKKKQRMKLKKKQEKEDQKDNGHDENNDHDEDDNSD